MTSSTRSPWTFWLPAALALLVASAAGAVILGHPAGTSEPEAPAVDEARSVGLSGTADVLRSRAWGEGRLVLVRFEDRDGNRHLGLAFTIDHGRGWRLGGWTEQRADVTDVRVGSLLVATSDGGAGQPPWTAAYGELSDDRIAQVQIVWERGDPTTAPIESASYLVLTEGTTTVTTVRFLAEDGSVIAEVPV